MKLHYIFFANHTLLCAKVCFSRKALLSEEEYVLTGKKLSYEVNVNSLKLLRAKINVYFMSLKWFRMFAKIELSLALYGLY